MTTARRNYHHGDLRAALIALAERHIAVEGVDSLSVRALAREAGVAHRAAYQHFPDKDALVAAVLTAAYDRLAERLSSADRDEDVERRLRAAASAYAQFALDEPKMFLAMTGPRVNIGGAQEDLEVAIQKCWSHIAEPVSEGCDAGHFRTDRTLGAAVFWGGLVGVLTQATLGRLKLRPANRAAFIDAVACRLIAGLRA